MRSGRRVLAMATLFVAACGYPSFDFLPDDSGVAPFDSTVDDVGSDVAHDAIDSSIDARVDAVVDTSMAKDTGVVDDTYDTSSPPPDTFVLDTGPPVDTHVNGCSDWPSARFCDDWDTSTTADFHWMSEYVVNGGALLLDAGDSSPNSFLSRFTLASTGTEEAADLVESITAPVSSATAQLDVDIKLSADHYTSGVVLAKIGRGGTGRGFDLSLGPSGFYVEILGTTGTSKDLTGVPVPVGRYFHLRMKGQVMSSGALVQIWIDDPSTAVFDQSGLSTATDDTTAQQLDLGLYTNGTPPFDALDVDFDTAAFSYP